MPATSGIIVPESGIGRYRGRAESERSWVQRFGIRVPLVLGQERLQLAAVDSG
jgi:hypothetical protein